MTAMLGVAALAAVSPLRQIGFVHKWSAEEQVFDFCQVPEERGFTRVRGDFASTEVCFRLERTSDRACTQRHRVAACSGGVSRTRPCQSLKVTHGSGPGGAGV